MPTTVIAPYIKQLADIKKEVPSQAYKLVVKLQKEIIPFITERQLYDKGIDGKGKFLGHYSPFTIALKKQKGERYDHTTLLDEGDFYEGFFAFGESRLLIMSSRDTKTAELISRYGEDIFTLTVEHNDIVNETIILPALLEWFLDTLEI